MNVFSNLSLPAFDSGPPCEIIYKLTCVLPEGKALAVHVCPAEFIPEPHGRVEGERHIPQSCPLMSTCELWRVCARTSTHTHTKYKSTTVKFHCVSLVTTSSVMHFFLLIVWISPPGHFLCPLLIPIKLLLVLLYLFECFACMYACVLHMYTVCTEVRRGYRIHWEDLQQLPWWDLNLCKKTKLSQPSVK